MTKPTITAAEVKELLAQRHSKDVFVAECKTGSTWGGDFRILDGWAMRRSWSPFTTIGYEVKVARSDFERDQKWTEYLKVCHEFSFVCPAGLIKAADLPPGVGLVWVTANKQGLHTKIKPARREPDPAALIATMTYVLMSRSRVVADMYETHSEPKTREESYREMVEQAERSEQLAAFVNAHVRARFQAQADKQHELERRVLDAESLEEYLAGLGVKREKGIWRHSIERQIDRLLGRVPYDLPVYLDRAITGLETVKKALGEISNNDASGGATP